MSVQEQMAAISSVPTLKAPMSAAVLQGLSWPVMGGAVMVRGILCHI